MDPSSWKIYEHKRGAWERANKLTAAQIKENILKKIKFKKKKKLNS